MKKNLHKGEGKLIVKVCFLVMISVVALGHKTITAQVNFTQTLNADFNKGVVNNAVVGSDNVSLQFSASDVGSWLTTTVLPQTLTGHRTASWNDRFVYMVGGFNNLNYVNTVYVATIQSGGISGWNALNPLPVALRDPAVVIGTNTIYVMGGRNATQVFNTIYYAAINTDGTIGTWQTSSVNLPVNLWGHTATYLMGHIYIVGGSSSMVENTALNSVYVTRVNATNTLSSFSTGTNLSTARNRHSAVAYNNRLYVMGGYDNAGTRTNTVTIATPALNGTTGTWTAGANLPIAISNHSSVVTNGLITVMAGAYGTTLSNTVYYANADAGTLSWNASGNVMYDFTKDGSAFTGNGQIYYTGGTNLSGTPIINCRFANMVLTTNYIAHGVFVSNPFYELGAERLINTLTFNRTFTAPANLQISYRTALNDGVWSDWTALVTASPVTVNLTRRYLQYAVIMTGSTVNNSTFHDMTLTTPGTQLAGNLNATTTFTKALSPYWATSDISFTAGTHTFQAGATILFLPETGLTIGAANVICNGVVGDSVRFTYYTNETGKWDGIYFNEDSDNGVSSQFYYTVISNAGFGSNNANLYCYQSNEPLLSRCNIRYSDGDGIRLNSAHISIQNTSIRANTENGLYLNNSNPTLVTSAISYNGGAGVYYTTSASVPNFSSSGTTINNNMYAFRYPSPNFTIYQPNGTPTLTANTYNGICFDGGDINTNCRWNSVTYDYILLGTASIVKYASYVRLTIEPGNTIKGLAGTQLQVGRCGSYGGELYALGTADSLITFTSHNGLIGGWDGIYFTDCSDNWGGHSQLDYCVIERGNDYNYLTENSVQPDLINHTIIRNSLTDGARYLGSSGAITNCQFMNNGRYPLYYLNPEANPVHTGNTFTGNAINRITLSGGNYNNFDRTITNDGVPYYVLNDIVIMQYAGHSRLTINPGVTLEFAEGKKLQVGLSGSWGGDLYAQGTAASPITFKAYNNTSGGWGGIHFTDFNDNWGGTSVLEYCTITQGATYNILCESSTQPSLNYCTISNSALHGIVEFQSSGSIQNCQFTNNNGYPIKYNDWTCNSFLKGNTYTGNSPNYIALSGGDYSSDRTLYNDGVPYHVLANIRMGAFASHARLTVKPGITLAFDPGVWLQLGRSSSYGGDLFAEGKIDSLIIFKPYNNIAGGWAGIYFTDWNDNWSGTSSMKYCNVEKGDTYNMNCENSGQPLIDHCTFSQSTGNGLNIVNSTLTIRNSSFVNNAGYGINIEGTGSATLGNTSAYTCNLYNNSGAYDLYNNSTTNTDARYNFWGSGDSTMIALRIYDKSDNTSRGRVYFGPFAQVPSLMTPTTVMGGTVRYAYSTTYPMKNAAMVIKDFAGTTINTATTNTSGVYAFPSMVSGNYRMTITPSNVWGGVNSTDALNIMNHFAQITPLTGMKLAAADVNYSHSINGTDALLVMQRYSGMITSFPAGNYLYHYASLANTGSTLTGNIDMLCFGDVNASYTPAKKSTGSTGLVYEGTLIAESFTEFDFPVRLITGMEVGAISLGFYYPEEYLEVTGAQLADGASGFSWTAFEGLFRMAWCSIDALNIGDDEVVVILKMKAKDLSGLTSGISLDIYEESEFADGSAIPNELAIVSIPVINSPTTGIVTLSGQTGLLVYPNPVSGKSMIDFSIEVPGKIRLSLLNILGTPVMEIVDHNFTAGNYKIELQAASLKPGIYLLKFENTGQEEVKTNMIKIVVTN